MVVKPSNNNEYKSVKKNKVHILQKKIKYSQFRKHRLRCEKFPSFFSIPGEKFSNEFSWFFFIGNPKIRKWKNLLLFHKFFSYLFFLLLSLRQEIKFIVLKNWERIIWGPTLQLNVKKLFCTEIYMHFNHKKYTIIANGQSPSLILWENTYFNIFNWQLSYPYLTLLYVQDKVYPYLSYLRGFFLFFNNYC